MNFAGAHHQGLSLTRTKGLSPLTVGTVRGIQAPGKFEVKDQLGCRKIGEDYCDIVVFNKKYIFGLHSCSWHRAPKIFGISYLVRAIKVSCYS